jgi:hypothetical protein
MGAHLLYIGPVQEAAEVTPVWVVSAVAICLLIAAIVRLGVALALGESRPVWLRFMRLARDVATVLGCGLVFVGPVHHRDTEPQGEVRWLVLWLSVLVGAAAVHWWVNRADRRYAA